MNRKYKCRFCDYETSDYSELIKHEAECYKKEEEKFQISRKKELDEDVAKLNSLRQEWFDMCTKLRDRYSEGELRNVKYLFSGYDLPIYPSPHKKVINNNTNTNDNTNSMHFSDIADLLKYFY